MTAARTYSYWDKGQIKQFVRDLRKDLGTGWRFMTVETRCAFVASKALTVARGQARETIDVAALDELYCNLLSEAGLE